MGSVSGVNNHKCVANGETIKARSFHNIFYSMNILKYFYHYKKNGNSLLFSSFHSKFSCHLQHNEFLESVPVSFYPSLKTQRPLEKSFTWLNFVEYI